MSVDEDCRASVEDLVALNRKLVVALERVEARVTVLEALMRPVQQADKDG